MMPPRYGDTLSTLVLIYLLHYCNGHMHDVLPKLDTALKLEMAFSTRLLQYVEIFETRLAAMKRLAKELPPRPLSHVKDRLQALQTPVNEFHTVKRMAKTWPQIEKALNVNPEAELISKMSKAISSLMDNNTLDVATTTLLELQDTYNLDPVDLSRGMVAGRRSPKARLRARDAFYLGQFACDHRDIYYCIIWLQHTQRLLKAEGKLGGKMEATTLDYLAHCAHIKGNNGLALQLTKRILEIDKKNSRAKKNLGIYKGLEPVSKHNQVSEIISNPRQPGRSLFETETPVYEALCRGETIKGLTKPHKHSCKYDRSTPYFLLRPLKEEVMHTSPLIVVYHDFITEHERETIIKASTPNLRLATVFDGSKHIQTKNRKSHNAWLEEDDFPVVSRVNKKVEGFTGLLTAGLSSDNVQVVKYSIGGYYQPHRDHRQYSPLSRDQMRHGQRISTSLFYLNDVTAGGATIFPKLGVSIKPEKGAMVHWYNLYRSGEGIADTLHAGCPVLLGTKWISNLWIHQYGNELRRKCHIDPNL